MSGVVWLGPTKSGGVGTGLVLVLSDLSVSEGSTVAIRFTAGTMNLAGRRYGE
jgi:hypothetical protein